MLRGASRRRALAARLRLLASAPVIDRHVGARAWRSDGFSSTASRPVSRRPLWAPWRTEYVTRPKRGSCLFCAVAAGEDPDKTLLERGARCFTLLNAYPYASGHVMVAPYRHVAGLEDLDEDELLGLMTLTRRAMWALREVMSPDGFNAGLNLGEVAGAGIADHLHMHLVPRWQGDTNFMPVLADTHVLPQALAATCEALSGALARAPQR